MQEQFDAFLDGPTRGTALALQAKIRATAGYTADTPWYERARTLLEQGRHDEVIHVVSAAMPGAFLSPWAHQFLSRAHAGLGATEDSRREGYYAAVGLDLIAATGDGTAPQPWQVLHVADEYAFLDARGVAVEEQELLGIHDGLALDALTCTDGLVRHFRAPVVPREE